MKLTRSGLFVGLAYIWIIFLAFAWLHDNAFGLLNIIGFPMLIITPGLLTVLGLGRGKRGLPFWHRFGQIIGWSVLEIILIVLISNTILPHLHVGRPLDRRPLLFELTLLVLLVGAWSWYRLQGFSYRFSFKSICKTYLDVVFTLTPLAFIALSVMGAVSLNNGGTNVLTMIMLIMMGGYACILFGFRKRLNDNTFAWAIYMMALSLLLMTSLRGWYTTGHDIEREFRVFQLAKENGIWNIAVFRDPFNACLSITILPTIFANMLSVPDPFVYKVFFQIIFATTPVLIFLFMRRYLSRGLAFLAVIYFIAFPTYITDMPMLNRQEIAFLFLALMLLIIFDVRITLKCRRWLFLVFGIGMVLAHYSTTYSTVFILVMMVAMRPIFNWLAVRIGRWKFLRQTSIALPKAGKKRLAPNITFFMVAALAVAGFLWNSVLTDTSTATSVISTTISNITSGLKEDSHSNDVTYSLLSGSEITPRQQLHLYQQTTVAKQRDAAPADTYFSNATVYNYPLAIVPESVVPLSVLGKKLSSAHIDVGNLNYTLKQTSAKLLQIFVAIGFVYVLFRKKFNKSIEPEFLLLGIGCLVFLAMQVVLPYLSIAYGILRAFQQSLMLIGLFLVVGTCALTVYFRNSFLKSWVPAALALLFFFSSTGVISQLLGGYQPQLHLNNSGQYYDTFYLHKQEVEASFWLQNALKQPGAQADVQTDLFTATRLNSLTGINASESITPGLVERNSYVMLGYTDVTKDQVTVSFTGNLIAYKYPMQFLNQSKNLIYDNGGAKIYR